MFPPCCFTSEQIMVEVMKIMNLLHKFLAAALSAPDPEEGHYQPMPLLETPGHSQASLGRSFVGSLLLSPGSWCAKFWFVPSKSLLPQSCGSSVIKSHWPSNSMGFSVPLPDP